MKTQDTNHSPPPVVIQSKEATALKNAHQDAALDEALCESFPASDPIAVSFTLPYAPDQFKVPNRNSQIENEKRQMAELGVTFDGRSYCYREYHYDLLADALDFARLDYSNPGPPNDDRNPTQWKEPEKPTEAEQLLMATLAITFDGRYYRYHDYRYDRLVDAIHFAQLKQSPGAM